MMAPDRKTGRFFYLLIIKYTNMYNYLGNCMAGYGFGGLGMIIAIIWWIVVVVLIIFLARWIMGRPQHRRGAWRMGEKSAMDILEERYAKGEINKEEFEAKKKDLMNDNP